MIKLSFVILIWLTTSLAKSSDYLDLLDGNLVEESKEWNLETVEVQAVHRGFGEEIDLALPPKSAVKAEQEFSIDLYNALTSSQNAPNMVMSPLSIYTVLSMLRPGLQGRSLEQVNHVMHLQTDQEDLTEMYDVIRLKTKKYKLRSANRIYFDKSLKLRRQYRDSIKRTKIAQTKRVNFAAPEKARTMINKFVYKRTRKLIENLLPENAVDENTKMYLVNALYLKADWMFKFSKKRTRRSKFQISKNEFVPYTLMTNPSAMCYQYFDTTLDSRILSIPMQGGGLSMVFFVPNQAGNFSKYKDDDKQLLSNNMENALKKVQGSRAVICQLSVPKFKVEYETDLANTLKLMGIQDVFTQELADLSLMTTTDPGLFVQEVRHKAVLEAAEGGIEAAGSSAMSLSYRSRVRRVRINKPFMFVVKHNLTGTIMFMGKITRPSLK